MEQELNINLNDTGKFRSEYLTSAIKTLSKLDSYKDVVFNNINKNLLSRVEKLQNLKSRINRIRAILPKINEYNSAITIKSKKYYPKEKHTYYQYINLHDQPEEITNLINTNYNCTNPNIPKINIKKPLVQKPDSNVLGKIPRETFDDCISSQLLCNIQKKFDDLASELYNLRIKNIGSSLINEMNDLVYEKTNYLETSFDFMNKKLIQKADLLWTINKEDAYLRQNINNQIKNIESEEFKNEKKSTKKLIKLQEAPKSIITKVKIEKDVNKKVLLEKTEKQEFNLPTSINLGGIAELRDEIPNEEIQNNDENIYPEREEFDFDYENQTDINNINLDDDIDLPIDIITRKNLENLKNEGNINLSTPAQSYNYQTANVSNINNNSNTININVNSNMNYNNNINTPVSSNVNSGSVAIISGKGPGVPPPPPPPPPPPVVPVKPTVEKKTVDSGGEGGEVKKEEPKKEISMAEELAMIKLKKVGTLKTPEIAQAQKQKPTMSHNDLLRQQILLRFNKLRMHEKKNDDEEEEENEEEF